MRHPANFTLLFSAAFAMCSGAYAQNFEWAKSMGGTMYDNGYSIAVDDAGNVYTTGSFEGTVDFDPSSGLFYLNSIGDKDIFVSKLDASGNFV